MSRPVLVTLASFAAVAVAHAADPAGPVAPVPAFSWTGFYLGASAAGAFGQSKFSYIEPGFQQAGTFSGPDLAAGLFTGSTLRIGDRFVVGAESDGDVSSLRQTRLIEGGWLRQSLPLSGSVRARLGYLVSEKMLAYGTAGLFRASTVTDGANTATVVAGFHRTGLQAGYTLGAGIDYALDAHWFARAELRHDWVQPWSVLSGTSVGIDYNLRRDLSQTSMRFGLAYMAGDTATVVRNY